MSFVCIAFIITKLIQMNDFPLLARYVTVGTGGMAWWTSCKMLHKRHLLNLGCRQLVPLCDVDSGHSFPLLKKSAHKTPPSTLLPRHNQLPYPSLLLSHNSRDAVALFTILIQSGENCLQRERTPIIIPKKPRSSGTQVNANPWSTVINQTEHHESTGYRQHRGIFLRNNTPSLKRVPTQSQVWFVWNRFQSRKFDCWRRHVSALTREIIHSF